MDTTRGHTQTCTFVPVSCPNGCTSSGKFLLEHLDHHLRECPNRLYTCAHCGKYGTYTSITEAHDKVCPKKVVACLQCGHLLERWMITEHKRTSCKVEEVPRLKQSTGCEVTMTWKEIQQFGERDGKVHLDTPQVEDQIRMLMHGEPLTIALPGYSKLKINEQRFYTKAFYTHERYKMRVVVDPNGTGQANGTYVSLLIEILKGRYDSELQWPLRGTVTIVLLNQLSSNYHHEQSVHLMSPCCSEGGIIASSIEYFISHKELSHDSASHVKYLVKDTLLFRIKVTVPGKPQIALRADRPPCMSQDFRNPAYEHFTFKIQGYSAEDKYVSEFDLRYGHTVIVKLISKPDYLSLLVKVESKLGSSLDLFEGVLQVELLNQLEDRNHYAKLLKVARRNTTTGSISLEEVNFIHWTALALTFGIQGNTWYLVNDNLFFRITVGTEKQDKKLLEENQQDTKPWLECTAECWKC